MSHVEELLERWKSQTKMSGIQDRLNPDIASCMRNQLTECIEELQSAIESDRATSNPAAGPDQPKEKS